MDQIFHIGDMVMHKELGFKMIVLNDNLDFDSLENKFYFNGCYRCGWYDKEQDLMIGIFPQESLEFLRKKERNSVN